MPLSMTIQDGCKPILEWIGSEYAADSNVTQLIREACRATVSLNKACYLLMDRYFLSVPGLVAIQEECKRADRSLVTLVTKAKSNTAAYEKPAQYCRKGRPALKGNEVKLSSLFADRANDFQTAKLNVYGERKDVQYLCVDMLWGKGLYQELRFVLTIIDGCHGILVSNDLASP